jgi:hypothetical protein
MKHADTTDGAFTWDTAERVEADKFMFGWEGKGPMEKAYWVPNRGSDVGPHLHLFLMEGQIVRPLDVNPVSDVILRESMFVFYMSHEYNFGHSYDFLHFSSFMYLYIQSSESV